MYECNRCKKLVNEMYQLYRRSEEYCMCMDCVREIGREVLTQEELDRGQLCYDCPGFPCDLILLDGLSIPHARKVCKGE